MLAAYKKDVFRGINKVFAITVENKISWKAVAKLFTEEGIRKTQEIMKNLDSLKEEIQTSKLKSKHLSQIRELMINAQKEVVEFDELMGLFKIDTAIIKKFAQNSNSIDEKLDDIIQLLDLYASILKARNEIQSGQTLTHEELFDV